MKIRYYLIVLLLVGGHLISEFHSVLYWVCPRLEFFMVEDWFIDGKTKVSNMNALWYSKMVEDMLLLCALVCAGASQAYSRNYATYLAWQRYSFRLYTLWVIYFFYHVFDMVMFFYNYKTSYVLYMIILVIVTCLSLFVAFYRPNKKESPEIH